MTAAIDKELKRIPMSPALASTLARAAEYATEQAHVEVTAEHLLLALTEDDDANIVLAASNVDIAQLKTDVASQLGRIEERLPLGQEGATRISTGVRRILEASAEAAKGRRNEINGAIVLAAIVGEGTSPAAHLLRAQGLTFEEAIKALQSSLATAPATSQTTQPTAPPRPASVEPSPVSAPPPSSLPSNADEFLAQARERVKSRDTTFGGPPKTDDTSGDGAIQESNAEPAGGAVEGAPSPPAAKPSTPRPAPPQPAPPREPPNLANKDSWAPPKPAPRPAPQPQPYRPPPPVPVPVNAGNTAPPHTPHPQGLPGAPHGQGGSNQQPPRPDAQNPNRAPPSPPWPAQAERAPLPPGGRRPGQQYSQQPHAAAGQPRPHTAGHANGPLAHDPNQRRGAPSIESGQLVENIPRVMQVDVPAYAEVAIAKAEIKDLAAQLEGGAPTHRHDLIVTKAMTVRLRAPDGGFFIETASPETQWIENALGIGSDDFANWRWTITPKSRGRKRLQVIVSARTVGTDGLAAETALPDQVIDVRVKTNYARSAKSLGVWITAAVGGGLLAQFGQQIWTTGQQLVQSIMSGG